MHAAMLPWRHLYLSVPRSDGDARIGLATPDAWARALGRERLIREGAGASGSLSRPLRSLLVGGEAPTWLGPELPELVRELLGDERGGLDGIPEWTVEIGDARTDPGHVARWMASGVMRVSLRGDAATPEYVAELATLPGLYVAVDFDVASQAAAEPSDIPDRVDAFVAAGVRSMTLIEPESEEFDDAAATRWWSVAAALDARGWILPDVAHAHAPDAALGQLPTGAAHPPVHPEAIRRRWPVLGLGPGAVTFAGRERCWNQEDPALYLASIEAGIAPRAGKEMLTRSAMRLERIWSGLRSARGIPLPPRCRGVVRNGVGAASGSPPRVGLIERWCHAGWGRTFEGRFLPTREGWLRADGLAVELAAMMDRDSTSGASGEKLEG